MERPISEMRERGARPERIRVTICAADRLLLAAALGPDNTVVALHRAERDPHDLPRIEAAFEALTSRLAELL